MKRKMRFFGILFSLVLIMGLVAGWSVTALADDPVPYKAVTVDATTHAVTFSDAQCSEYTLVGNSGEASWSTGWYVVKDTKNITGYITVDGDVKLILCDGAKLTVNGGIKLPDTGAYTLTIYGQSENSGKLVSNGIGSVNNTNFSVTVNGGVVEAVVNDDSLRAICVDVITINGGSAKAEGNGSYSYGIEGNVVVNGGTVTAKGTGSKSYGIEGNVVVNGGRVTAKGTGYAGIQGSIVVNGGTVTAEGDPGINFTSDGMTVNGGSVTATSKASFSSAIDGSGDLVINDGSVTVTTSGNKGINVSKSVTISGGTVNSNSAQIAIFSSNEMTISGGTVTATSSANNAIYAGSNITFSSGTVTATGSTDYGTIESSNKVTFKGAAKVKATNSGNGSAVSANDGIYFIGTTGVTGENESKTSVIQTDANGKVTSEIGKYLSQEPLPHTHSFSYSASDTIITATCVNTVGNCPLTDRKVTLTIVAPTLTKYGETGKSAAATLTGLEAFNTATSKSIAESEIKYVGRDGTAYAESATAPTNAGKYSAKITIEGKTAKADYEIAKVATSVTTVPTAAELTYGQTLADSTLTGGTASVAGTFVWKDSTVAPAVPDSQKTEYDVVFTPTDGNYGTAECRIKLTVNKADSAVTKAPEAKTLTFSGSAQELIIKGEVAGGVMQYVLGTDSATVPTSGYAPSIPAKTEAGTYYVWYKVKGDENHSDTAPAGPVTVTISESVAEIVTITFDEGEGTGTMAPVQIEKGSQYTFPKSSFIPPANKVFAHWIIGEKQYAVNDTITVTADLKVTAVWGNIESKIVTNDLTSVPKELTEKFSSVTELENALLRELSSNGQIASRDNCVFLDAELMVLIDGVWVKATEENFPKNKKLPVTFPYPAGTSRNTHDFSVVHMFTVPMNGHPPGKIETPKVTKGKDGLTAEFESLSPVAISWTKIDEKAIDSLPQTGDTERPLLYGLTVLFALIGIGWLTKKK